MTARYLLDTDICIYIAKHKPPEVIAKFEELTVGEAVMSFITLGELRAGANKSNNAKRAHETFDALVASIPVHMPAENVSDVYGDTRSKLEQRGQIIGPNDLWIAAHAIAADLTLVTNNQREFSRVPNLRLETWVAPD